jgi:hypothetical protein
MTEAGITINFSGKLGDGIARTLFIKLHKGNLWPVDQYYKDYSKEDLFDMIEFLFDYVSKPEYAQETDLSPTSYDKSAGQESFRVHFNEKLGLFEQGYVLSEIGEITNRPEDGLEKLLKSELPTDDDTNIRKKVDAAIRKYLSRHSIDTDRRDAVRDLADVLEFLRPKMKGIILEKDESDLFNIANNFGLRHHNENQKTNYDGKLWNSWLFYFYLSTIHLILRKIDAAKNAK